jgi:hypothetical protein
VGQEREAKTVSFADLLLGIAAFDMISDEVKKRLVLRVS